MCSFLCLAILAHRLAQAPDPEHSPESFSGVLRCLRPRLACKCSRARGNRYLSARNSQRGGAGEGSPSLAARAAAFELAECDLAECCALALRLQFGLRR